LKRYAPSDWAHWRPLRDGIQWTLRLFERGDARLEILDLLAALPQRLADASDGRFQRMRRSCLHFSAIM
jgi:hypothetical protein